MQSSSPIWEIFQALDPESLNFAYLGSFTDEVTDQIIRINESTTQDITDSKKLNKRVAFLIAESFQNIVRHKHPETDKPVESGNPEMFWIQNLKNATAIVSANNIPNKQISFITSRLEIVNQLNEDELHELYKEILTNQNISDKGGAGVGFIEMARKSGNKIRYDFEHINDEHSVFYLQLKMPGPDAPAPSFEFFKKGRHFFMQNSVLLMFKGDFSRESILPLLGIIDRNIQALPIGTSNRKKAYMVVVEMLQNVTRHGLETNNRKEGIFVVGEKNGLYVSVGNWVSQDEAGELVKKIEALNSLSPEGVKQLYRDEIRNLAHSDKGGAGLGLINMARFTGKKIVYRIENLNGEAAFISISLSL